MKQTILLMLMLTIGSFAEATYRDGTVCECDSIMYTKVDTGWDAGYWESPFTYITDSLGNLNPSFDGTVKWYKNGSLFRQHDKVNWKRHGAMIFYDSNGFISEILEFKHDIQVGEMGWKSKRGTTHRVLNYIKKYDDNGNMTKFIYYSNGIPFSKDVYVYNTSFDSVRIYTSLDEDTTKLHSIMLMSYDNMSKTNIHHIGIQYYFYSRRFLRSPSFNYVPDYYISSEFSYNVDGQQHGIETNYGKSGNVMTTYIYVNSKLHGDTESYYDNGQLRRTGRYLNGKTSGEFKWYNPSGILAGTANYKNGEVIGYKKCTDGRFGNGSLDCLK